MSDERTNGTPFDLVASGAAGLPAAGTPPPPPLAMGDEDEGGVDLRRYLSAVLRYKWIILLLVAVGTAGGFVASGMVQPEYVAQATIWIEGGGNQRGGTVDAGPIRSSELLEASAWVDLLRSFVVLDNVVIGQKLYLHPKTPGDTALLAGFSLKPRFAPGSYRLRVHPEERTFVLETADGSPVQRGEFGDSVGASQVGFAWQPDLSRFPGDRPVEFRVAVPRDEAIRLSKDLRTQIDKQGNFLRIELKGTSPDKTAGILNAVAERHVEVAADLKRTKIDTLVAILGDQLAVAEKNLKDAEIALEDFKINTITLPTEPSTPVAPGIQMTQDPVFSNYFSMKVELEQLRRDQAAIRRALGDGTGPVSVEALESVGPVQQSAELSLALKQLTEARANLRALRSRYTDEHRAVQQAQSVVKTLETQTVPTQTRAVLAELEARQQQLNQNIGSASSELRQIPPRAIEEARLQRRVAIADNLYTTLEQRYQEARLAAASSIPDIRILDEAAVPKRPVQDQKASIILMAVLGSLGLGVGGAILRDRLDRRFRYPAQVTHDLGLSILGGVPNLGKKRGESGHLSQVLEAFRTIRLNVTHAFGAGPITITITSPGPGDGKSFVASNLALSFADLGKKTMLVDGDIRRGTLHHLLNTDRKPGLTDFLNGQLPREKLVRHTRYKRLDLVPSGTRVRHGPELLGSTEMRQLLLELRNDYDVVIVDSPPLGAGVDPFALGTMTGNVVMVLRTGMTDRELAESKLELMERLPIRLLGAILNGVPQTREYGYGYYSYVSGYEAMDEDDSEMKQPLQIEG